MTLTAAILAGGESNRMGRDKAWLEVDGETLLARAVRTLEALAPDEILISGRAGVDYSAFGLPVVLDLEPGLGPIAGLERVLHAANCPLVLVIAVDMPRMTTSFLQKLRRRCDALTGALPRHDGQLEPLAAVYPKRCHAIALELVVQYARPARDFAKACLRERAVRLMSVATHDRVCFENWNTPQDATQLECPTGR